MVKFKKLAAVAMCVTLAAASFSACSKKEDKPTDVNPTKTEDPTKAPEKTDKTEDPTSAPVKETTLRWVVASPGGKQKDADMVAEAFNKELQKFVPGVTVKFDYWKPAEYVKKLDLAMAAGEQIDLAWKSYAKDKAIEYAAGTYTNLTDLVDDEVLKTLPEFLLKGATINGELCYLPKLEMHHSIEGMYTYQEKLEKYFDMDAYKAALADYYATATDRAYTDKMYDVIEDYMAKAKAAGDLGSGYSPYVSNMNKGQELIKGGVGYVMPPVLKVPVKKGQAWDTKIINAYTEGNAEAYFKKLADWKAKGYLRSDLTTLENPRVYENTNPEGDLIWYHNYVNADDIESSGTLQHAVRNGWEKEYAVVPFSAPVVSNGAQDGIMIPYTAQDPELSYKVMRLMFVEEGKDLKNLLVNGIEGTHWEFDANKKIVTKEGSGVGEDKAYGLPGWALGNTHTLYLNPTQPDNTFEYYDTLNANSIINPVIGFTFDLSNYDPMITSIKSLMSEYVTSFIAGDYTPERYQEYVKKLSELGIDDLIADMQKQLDAFLASK